MASIHYIGETKKGKCYKIQVSRGRGKSPYSMRWYPKDGWSQTYIDKTLKKVAHDFEQRCKNGEVNTRAEKKQQIIDDQLKKDSKYTLHKYSDDVFMPALKVTASENTISNYNMLLRTRIIPQLGDKLLEDIQPADINAFLLKIQSDGLSTATAIKYYGLLNSLFKKAFKEFTILSNPMLRVDRPKKKKAESNDSTTKAFSIDETKYLLQCVEKEPLKWQVYIRLMIDTAIRRGECCALKWEDIDSTAGTITISHSLSYTPETGVVLTTPKNGKSRVLDVGEDIIDLLNMLKKDQEDKNMVSEYIFTQNDSIKPMHPQSPDRYLKKFGEKYGIKDIYPHKLRHTLASIAITNGADVESISEKLGHHDAGFTLKQYTHANAESIKKAGDIFREAIK